MRTTMALVSMLAIACSEGGYQNIPSDSHTDMDGVDSHDGTDTADGSGCGSGCPTGMDCVDGLCRSRCTDSGDCPGALECCDGHCYNTSSEVYNCGECGNDCLPEGNACLSGYCSCNGAEACDEGYSCCNPGGCKFTMWDRENCGSCGSVCVEDQQCIGGVCGGSCASAGCPEVPHGTASCEGSECVISACDVGWVDGDGVFENGCECEIDVTDFGAATCLEAYNLGSLSDSPSSSVTTQGFTSPAAPEDWYTFTATDTTDTDCDTFHVLVELIVNPLASYQLDVYSGACDGTNECTDDITFEVDNAYSSVVGTEVRGECPCDPTAPGPGEALCSDNTATYYVVVHLKADVTSAGCEPYTLSVSNGS